MPETPTVSTPTPTIPPSAAPGLPIEADEPVFHAPWQAKAFALTVSLHAAGVFTWPEWAEAFSSVLAAAPLPENAAAPESPRSEAYAEVYYVAWLEALERLVARQGVADPATLDDAAETWKRAAEATPHGTPILFETGLKARAG